MGTNPQLLPASSVQRDGDQILDLRGVVRKNPLIIPPPSLHLLTSTIHSLAPRGNEPGYEDVSLICLHSLSPSSLLPMAASLVSLKCQALACLTSFSISSAPAGCVCSNASAQVLVAMLAGRMVSVRPCRNAAVLHDS